MNRRTFLTASGTALTTPFSGCLSDSNKNSNANISDNRSDGRNTQEGKIIEEDPRVDIPPHEINTPKVKDHDDFDPNDWNDDYLGEHMEQEPSLSFDVLLQSSSNMTILKDELEWNEGSYLVKLVANKNDYEEVFNLDGIDEETQEQLTAVDFNESMLVVVESGWGSSSIQHQWVRVIDVEEGLHCHGYYTKPYEVTSDLASQLLVLEIE